jgi:hypothetical protein
MRAMLIDWM